MTEFVTSTDGTQLAYEIAGQGAAFMVYVHGAGGDRTSHAELKALFGRQFRILSYDRRGRGDSEDSPAYDLGREVEDLRAIIACCDVPPVVFAVSLGARIALELLRDPPEIAAMVLFEPPATDFIDPGYREKLLDIGAFLMRSDKEGAVARNLELLHGKTQQDIAEQKARTAEWATRVTNASVSHREMVAVHVTNLFEQNSFPVPSFPIHLLVGTETLPFIRQSADLISRLSFIKRHDLSGLNHGAPSIEPRKLCNALIGLCPVSS